MVMLHLEDVLLGVVIDVKASGLGGQLGFRSFLLGDEGSTGGRLGDLNSSQTGFLKINSGKKKKMTMVA